MISKEEVVKRLKPVTGFIDDKTGLLYIASQGQDFERFIETIRENEEDGRR